MKFMDFRKHFTGREVLTLVEIRAIEPSFYRARLIQDLTYLYDNVGNITHLNNYMGITVDN